MKVAQPCPTLCNPVDYTIHGILQARILEWDLPNPGDLPDPGIKPVSPVAPSLQADSVPLSHWEALISYTAIENKKFKQIKTMMSKPCHLLCL